MTSLRRRQQNMRARMQVARQPVVTNEFEKPPGLGASVLTSVAPSSVVDVSTVSKTAVAALCPRLLDLEAAGQYCGVSYWTIRDLVFAGEIPHVTLPNPRRRDGRPIRRILIDRHDLDAFIHKNQRIKQ
jgi:hypothetical protein